MLRLISLAGLSALFITLPTLAQDEGRVVTGRLGADSPRDGRPYALHTITLRAGQRYAIDVDSEEFDPKVEIFPVDGEVSSEDEGSVILADDDDGGEGNNASLELTPDESGPYKVRILSVSSNFGRYDLRIRRLPPLPPPSRLIPISSSTMTMKTYSGSISKSDPEVRNRHIDDYLVHLEAGKQVLIFTDNGSGDFDPAVSLFLNRKNLDEPIMSDDDSGEGSNALLTYTPEETDDYIIRITGSSEQSTGNYMLRIAD